MALQIKRGLTSNLPSSAADGELLFATDTSKLYVGNSGAPQEVSGSSQLADLTDLTDVTVTSPSTGQVLEYNGTDWVNGSIDLDSLTDVTVTSPSTGQVLEYNGTAWVNGSIDLDSIADVTITSPTTGQVLKYNGTAWVNGTDGGGSSTSGEITDLVAQTGLIGNVSIVDTTITAVDEYGTPVELVIGGDLTVEGDITSNSTLVVNSDGSKSISVSTRTTTLYQDVNWLSAQWPGTMSGAGAAGKLFFSSVSTATSTLLSSLVVGDKITFTSTSSGPSPTSYTFTIETAGFTYDPMYGVYNINVLEVSSSSGTVEFNYSYGVTVESGTADTYDFSSQAFTASNVVADTALVGSVSIIENTISAVDEYGAAGELIVDGDLTVTGSLSADNTLTLNSDGSKSVVVGGITTTTLSSVSWSQAAWASSMMDPAQAGKLTVYSPSQSLINELNSLAPGDTVTLGFGDFTPQYTTLTVETAGFTVDPMYGFYALNVVESNSTSSNVYFSTSRGVTTVKDSSAYYDFSEEAFTAPSVISDSAILGDVVITGNTISAVDANGYTTGADLSIVSDLVLEGDLTVSGEIGTPLNTSIPAAYTVVQHKAANGTVTSYYMPLYQ